MMVYKSSTQKIIAFPPSFSTSRRCVTFASLCDYDVGTTHEIIDDFVRVANLVADAASIVLKKFYEKPLLIQTFNKCDEHGCIVEQVTTADLAAEDAMTSVILQNFPDHLVFGEERGWLPERNCADYVWVLDPIDGTTSFRNGHPLFGTLIALLYKNKPILGIINQPILHKRWDYTHLAHYILAMKNERPSTVSQERFKNQFMVLSVLLMDN